MFCIIEQVLLVAAYSKLQNSDKKTRAVGVLGFATAAARLIAATDEQLSMKVNEEYEKISGAT